MTRRDWLFTIAILMISEYVVFNWTYSFASDKNLTDHISFAGTVVSIILAVVAIFYSFLQSESQNRSSNQIASQIGSLRDIVSEIDLSKSQFSSELDRIAEVASKLDQVGARVHESHQVLTNMHGEWRELKSKFEQSKTEEVHAPLVTVEPNVGEAIRPILEKIITATTDTFILSFLLNKLPPKGVEENTLLFKWFANPIANTAGKISDRPDEWKAEYWRRVWAGYSYFRVLKAMGCIDISGKDDVITVKEPLQSVLRSIKFEAIDASGPTGKLMSVVAASLPQRE